MGIEFKRVNEILYDYGIRNEDMPELNVCFEKGAETFKFMRAQIVGDVFYSRKQGAYINTEEHIKKCMATIEMAKKEFVDLLVFPEYSIPYKVLEVVCEDKELWPDKNRMWILPCCGIPNDEFRKELSILNDLEGVEVIDYDNESVINPKYFVNALFYLFQINDKGNRKLFVLPQLKTYAMRDIEYLCEEVGLSLGSKIYVFGTSNGAILLSLLCADVMNPDISLEQIQSMGSNYIILNPQLNRNPRNSLFNQFKYKLFSESEKSILITCNWSGGTKLIEIKEDANVVENQQLNLSWSCVYYKKEERRDFQNWVIDNFEVIKETEKANLYAGLMKESGTEVWYTDNCEVVHIFHIAKIRKLGSGIRRPKVNVGYVKKYVYQNGKLEENQDEFNLMASIDNTDVSLNNFYNKFDTFIKEKNIVYIYPFVAKERCYIDRFFDLVSGNVDWSFLQITAEEEVKRCTVVLTEKEMKNRKRVFSKYLYMIDALEKEGLHEHLKQKFEGKYTLYWDRKKEKYNLYERDSDKIKENGDALYIAYVENEDCAKELLAMIQNPRSKFFINELEICIMTQSETERNKLVRYPKINIDITKGIQTFSSTDIIGGDITDEPI